MATQPMLRHVSPVRALLLIALVAMVSASDCSVAQTDSTILQRLVPATANDTTFIGDTVEYNDPTYYDQNAKAVYGVNVAWANDHADIVQLLDPATYIITGDQHFTRFRVLALGEAHLTMSAPGSHFLNNVPLTFNATVVVLARPTAMATISQVTIRVGDSVIVAATVPSGTGGPNINRGTFTWTVQDWSIAGIRGYLVGQSATTSRPQAFNVTLLGASVGHTILTVAYAGPTRLAFQSPVDVYVVPTTVHVAVDRAANFTTTEAYDSPIVNAHLVNAAGQFIDPSGIQFTSRDPALATVRKLLCGDPNFPTVCSADVTYDNAEVLRRASPATVWIIASAGGVPPDSVQLTVYPGVESLTLTPLVSSISVGSSAPYTVVALDALGHVTPFSATNNDIFVNQDAPLGMIGVTLLTSGQATIVADSTPASGLLVVHLKATISEARPAGPLTIESPPATLTIHAVDHVVVTPANPVLTLGNSQQFTANGVDGAGRTVTLPLATSWRVAPTTSATVSPTGLLTAQAVGSVTVFATIGGVEGSTGLTVQPLPAGGTPFGMVITPLADHGPVGSVHQYVAYLVDNLGNRTVPIAGFSIGIQTDASTVAQIQSSTFDPTFRTQTANVLATGPGQTNVRAFYQDNSNGHSTFSAIATITVP